MRCFNSSTVIAFVHAILTTTIVKSECEIMKSKTFQDRSLTLINPQEDKSNVKELASFSSSTMSCDFNVNVAVGTDHNPTATSWELKNLITNEQVWSSMPYSAPCHQCDHASCFAKGTYEFSIYNDVGRGLWHGGCYALHVNKVYVLR